MTSFLYWFSLHLRFFGLGEELLTGEVIDYVGDYACDYVGDKLCPHDAVEAKEVVHYKEQWDIHDALTERGENKRLLAEAHCLEGEAYLHVENHKRHCEAENAKAICAHFHRFGISVKDGDNLGSEELEQNNTKSCKAHSHDSCAS